MRNLHYKYVVEHHDRKNVLCDWELRYDEGYNFAYDVVDDIAVNEPERRAMVWCNPEGEERVFTFGDMKRYSDRTANYLRALGVGKGDMVMVVLKRHYQFWFVAMALCKLGAVMVPATFMLTKHDVVYRVQSAGVKMVICTAQGDVAEAVEAAEPECPTLCSKVIVGSARAGWENFDEEMPKASESLWRVPTKASEPMIMFFSSGTSGYPKMVLHNHTYSLGHLLTAKHWHNVDPEGLHFTIADTGWGKAVWGKLYGQWLMEAGVFVYDFDKFEPDEIMALVEKYRITTLCCPPTMFRMFLRAGIEKHDLTSLQHVSIAGEALSPDVYEEWKAKTGLRLMEGFGQTETTLTVCNLNGMKPKPGSMGKPSPQYQVEILDEDGTPCPPGVTGEIVLGLNPKPVGLMDCYYNNPERTEEIFEGGWYHTGDTAWRDEDGFFWYVGRNDDIIKSSGYRIGPFEIESVLAEHPAVLECAVTGVPDPVRGQLVKATIVLFHGYEPTEELKQALQEHVKKETAPYKYPRVIEFVENLPRTVNGKIRRVAIREADWKKDEVALD